MSEEMILVREIMENKEILVSKVNDAILNVPSQNWSIILQNHIRYSNIIDNYIKDLTDTKLQIDKCVKILENTISLHNNVLNDKSNIENITIDPILEINIKGKKIGKLIDVQYESYYDENNDCWIFQIDIRNLLKKIKIMDKSKRYVLLHMVYDEGMTMILNVKFDFEKMDKSTGIIKGTYTVTKI